MSALAVPESTLSAELLEEDVDGLDAETVQVTIDDGQDQEAGFLPENHAETGPSNELEFDEDFAAQRRGGAQLFLPFSVFLSWVLGFTGLQWLYLWVVARKIRQEAGNVAWVNSYQAVLTDRTVATCLVHFGVYLGGLTLFVTGYLCTRAWQIACADNLLTISCLFSKQRTEYVLFYIVMVLAAFLILAHWLVDLVTHAKFVYDANRLHDFRIHVLFPVVFALSVALLVVYLIIAPGRQIPDPVTNYLPLF
jgi:hypothetical protein